MRKYEVNENCAFPTGTYHDVRKPGHRTRLTRSLNGVGLLGCLSGGRFSRRCKAGHELRGMNRKGYFFSKHSFCLASKSHGCEVVHQYRSPRKPGAWEVPASGQQRRLPTRPPSRFQARLAIKFFFPFFIVTIYLLRSLPYPNWNTYKEKKE